MYNNECVECASRCTFKVMNFERTCPCRLCIVMPMCKLTCDRWMRWFAKGGKVVKRIGDIENSRYSLTIYECGCGFHIGLDNTYMDQIGEILMECPACKTVFDTTEIYEMEESVGC